MNDILGYIKQRCYIFIALVAFFLIFYYIWNYAQKVPYWDQWELVPTLEKMHNHTLTLNDIWQQHNEHRIFFPKLLMLFLAYFSGWNFFVELCANLIMVTICLYLLFSMLDSTSDFKKNTIIKVIVTLLVFSMVQYENWLCGWQLQIFMSLLGSIITILSLNKWQGTVHGLIIAIAGAVLASYSFGSGLVIWPAALFFLIFSKNWRLKHIIIWIISCIVVVFLYFYQYRFSKTNAPTSYIFNHLFAFFQFMLAYLAAPLAWDTASANWISAILFITIILSILDIRRIDKVRLTKLMPWLSLIIFAILSAFLTGLGRIGLGIGQAMESRYTTISTLFVISAAVLLYNSIILNLGKNKKIALKDILFITLVSSAFLITYTINYRHGVKKMIERGTQINSAAFCLNDPNNATDDDLKKLYPHPDIIRKRIKILSDIGIKFDEEK